MSGSRFDKWRAWATEAVENDLRERDFALDRWGGDVRRGAQIWGDYLSEAFDKQTSFGQLVSGAMVVAYWWLRSPFEFFRSFGLPPLAPCPPRQMYLPAPQPEPSATAQTGGHADAPKPSVVPVEPAVASGQTAQRSRVTKAPRKTRAKARRTDARASQRTSRKRRAAG